LKIVLSALVCLLTAGTMFAQANAQPETTPRAGTAVQDLPTLGPETQVAPDAAVITIKGVCDKSSSSASSDCNTVVTRADFEKFVNAVNPNMPKQMQKQMASRFVSVVILSQKAHAMGLDQGPTFDEKMYLARIQLLAGLAGEQIQKSAGQVSDAEIEDYYKQHSGEFKTISYDKIFVPKQKSGTSISANDPDAQKKRQAAEDEMKQEAEKLRTRAAAGEDFVKLQQEAYDFSGTKLVASASNTHVDKVAKAHMAGNDAAIFDLKKGEVSQVISDPQGLMIYKVVDLQNQQLADVREEVSRSVQSEKLKAASESLQKQSTQDTTYNDAYFAVPPAPSLRKPGEEAPAPAAAGSGKPAASTPAPGKK
jgi:PPIC-type PPIASE domain